MNHFEETAWAPPDTDNDPAPVQKLSPAVTHSSCGKAIIVGEHAVVYGAEAIAMPLTTMRITARVKARSDDDGIRLFLDGKSVSDHLAGVVEDALHRLGAPRLSLDVEGNSGVLIGAGLGSSASLCIVILRALSTLTGEMLSTERLAILGNELEKRFHGNPSGLDTAVVAHESVIRFRRGEGGVPLKLGRPEGAAAWPFVLMDSGLRSSTASMIRVAEPFFKGKDADKNVGRFDQLSACVAGGLATGAAADVGETMNEAHTLLREAGVSNPRMDEMISVSRELGVLGAKMTGAGGGGCVLALLDPMQSEEQLRQLKQKIGARHVYSVRLNG